MVSAPSVGATPSLPASLPTPAPRASTRRPSASPGTSGRARIAAISSKPSTPSPMSAQTVLMSASARLAGVLASTAPSQRGCVRATPMSSQVCAPPSASITSSASVTRVAVAPAPPGTSSGPRPASDSAAEAASIQVAPLPV
ncbi:hypothetical protein ACFJIX_16875 [Roseateles sp. UC29_93]|uniref:hypothetical protein n=1 Tax=Roseateles sp. UC29_93 TaxID=3350177 RepID=UPI00366B7509